MTIERWLAASTADARQRDLPDLVPLLQGLATALTTLRSADFNDQAGGPGAGAPPTSARTVRPPGTAGDQSTS